MKIVLIVLLVLVVLVLALSGVLFCVAMVRAPWNSRREFLAAVEKEYRPQVRQGIRWIKEQKTEPVEITSYDGLTLRGIYLPAENPKGCLLVMHGFRSDIYLDYSVSYQFYHELGYDVLSVYQRGHGRSEGRYICFGVKERYDCQRWAEYAARRFGPERDIFLGGLSMGSATVLMATGLELPASVRGVIADCGFTSPRDEFLHVMKRMHLPRHPFLDITNWLAKRLAGFSFDEYSTLEALQTNRLPVLFLHGGADHFVPTEMSRRNYEACQAPKELVVVEGAGHGVSFLVDQPRCAAALKGFLEQWGSGVKPEKDTAADGHCTGVEQ